ncbi:MAG: hypothetical protein Q9204_004671 [Flavoplaca sp. TL-2023a]
MPQDPTIQTFIEPDSDGADEYSTVVTEYADQKASQAYKDSGRDTITLPNSFDNGANEEENDMGSPSMRPKSSTVSWQQIYNVTSKLIHTCKDQGGNIQFGLSLDPKALIWQSKLIANVGSKSINLHE